MISCLELSFIVLCYSVGLTYWHSIFRAQETPLAFVIWSSFSVFAVTNVCTRNITDFCKIISYIMKQLHAVLKSRVFSVSSATGSIKFC